MEHFTEDEKAHFRLNGFVVKHNVLNSEQVSRAVDVLWNTIEADRDDPNTWIDAGPRGNLECAGHPDILATLHDTSLIDMSEELAGKDRLCVSNNPFCKMVYPTGRSDWSLPDIGHMDGYTTPGKVNPFTVGLTVNISDIKPRGGGFTAWPGTHKRAYDYFKQHSLLNGQAAYSVSRNAALDLPTPFELTAPPGTVCFWHHLLMHSASMNCNRDIRMAFVSRLVWKNINDIMFEFPDDMWEHWDGL